MTSTTIFDGTKFLILSCLLVSLCDFSIPPAYAAGEITAWGDNSYGQNGQTNVPSGLSNVVAIAAGDAYSLALRADGTIAAWGYNGSGQTKVPSGLSNVVAVAAGDAYSLALRADGTVAAWGDNGAGQTNVPSDLSNVVAIAAGGYHCLGLRADGSVAAWGYNGYGETNVPSGLSNVVAIAAGYSYSLALRADGTVAAWGDNSFGQTHVPSGLSNVVAIAAGDSHSLALRADGTITAWGGNYYGQTTVPSDLSNVVAIAAGDSHSLALRADGSVAAWGYNNYGQTNVPNGLSNVVAVAAGGDQSLALTGLPDGVAAPQLIAPRFFIGTVDRPFQHRIMAKNGATSYSASGLPPGLAVNQTTGLISGQPTQDGTYLVVLSATNALGENQQTVTMAVNLPLPYVIGELVQAVVGSSFNYRLVTVNTPEWLSASGLPLGLAIDPESRVISGTALELGDFAVSVLTSNQYGLGSGCLTIRVSAHVAAWGNKGGQTSVPSGLGNVVAVAAGDYHSLVLRADGTVAAWSNYYNGSVYILMTVPSGLSNVVAIAAGGAHSLALRADGTVVAWGNNGSGQTNVPSGLSNVVAVAGGYSHSLVLRADGSVAAWGDNGSGRTTVPSGLSNVVAIAAGGAHSLALRADGTVTAWGDNTYGQTNVPSGLSNVVAVAGGGLHSLVLRADGTVAAWGFNYYGQANVPSGLSNVVAVAGGELHSLALRADGTVAAWGYNGAGQTYVPSGLSNVVAVAAGKNHSLGLAGLSGGVAAPQLVETGFLIGTVDRPFQHRIMAKNGVTTYSASGLPPGLVVNPTTGLITGQPTQAGTYSVLLSATNALGQSQQTVTMVVNLPLKNGELVQAVLGIGFNYRVLTLNTPETLSAVGLPSGLTINSASGVISGTALELGDFVVSVLASNRYGLSSGFLTIRVSSVAVLGDNTYGQRNVPSGLSNVVAVAAGGDQSLALRADGSVADWGDNTYGQTNVPKGLSNVVAVAAGSDHSLALQADSTVAAWGFAATVLKGLSNVVAVATGSGHSLALRANGTVAAWGYNGSGQTNVPSDLSNVVAIAAGSDHSLALRANGTVAAWGDNGSGQTNVPLGLSNVVAVAAGGDQSLALTGLPDGVAAPQLIAPRFLIGTVDRPFQHRIMAKNGATSYNASGLPPGLSVNQATGLITGQPTQDGTYLIVLSATNALGENQQVVTMAVNLPLPYVKGELVQAVVGSDFNYRLVTVNTPEWLSASGLPLGLVIDPASRVISGTALELGDFCGERSGQ